jgi:hypothetical protein
MRRMITEAVRIPLDTHGRPYWLRVLWKQRAAPLWPGSADKTHCARTSHALHVFAAVHPQYCHVQCFAVSPSLVVISDLADLVSAMVSVPFHQIMRATCPIFTIIIYRVFFMRKYVAATYISLVPIIGGVGLATYGDYYFTPIGFVLTATGVFLAAVKTVVTNRLLTGRLRLGPLEVLLRMCPLAAVQSLLYSVFIGEFSDFVDFVGTGSLNKHSVLAIAGNGLLAFALNIASFQANKQAGALSMTVCANLKQCLTIVLGAILW